MANPTHDDVVKAVCGSLGRERAALWLTDGAVGLLDGVLVIQTPWPMVQSVIQRLCQVEMRKAAEQLGVRTWRVEISPQPAPPPVNVRTKSKELFA
jgi:hypothetical protein